MCKVRDQSDCYAMQRSASTVEIVCVKHVTPCVLLFKQSLRMIIPEDMQNVRLKQCIRGHAL